MYLTGVTHVCFPLLYVVARYMDVASAPSGRDADNNNNNNKADDFGGFGEEDEDV